MSYVSRARTRVCALLSSVVALCTVVLAPAPAAHAAVLMPGASLAHPYSDPVWWPVRTETKMMCYHGNPGCRNPVQHITWLMDIVSTDFSTRRPHEPVYAMGAGILHYGVHHDTGCGGENGRGNFIYIDHGNGTLSWYGHMAWPFSVPDGAYVTPQTQIGLMGNSGYWNCRTYPTLHELDIAVKHNSTNGHLNGTYVELHHLFACVRGVRQSWPEQVNSRWQKWNDVPNSLHVEPHILPASDRNHSCISKTPATPSRTTIVHLRRSGTDALRATWTIPTTGPRPTSTVVMIQEYHPAIRRWTELRKHVLAPTRTSTSFGALHHKHSFRVMVTFHNGVGYSANSPWASAQAR